MKKINAFLILVLAGASAVAAQQPPTIVESSPRFWQTSVSPSLKQISVVFDQRMREGFSSWLGRSSVLPESEFASNNSADGQTFALSVSLQPGKVYVFALNEKNIPGVGFQNQRGFSAAPYYLVFQTSGNSAPDDTPPRVISTLPSNDTQQVDPTKLTSVSVTFDKPMSPAKHGMQITEDKKPVDLSKAKFQYSADGRSFSVAYQFKPSSTYEFELNSTQNIGFASAQRIPLWPVRFAFTTGQPQ